MTKVIFFGTHPKQYNGYSKVVYELARNIVKHKDIDLTIYGFQCFNNPQHKHREDIGGYTIYDAHKEEGENKTQGFGIHEIQSKVSEIKPDICIIYNDMLIISSVIKQLIEVKHKDMKIVAYVDQVYLNQKKENINNLNNFCDHVITFTKYWDDILKEQGLKVPSTVIEHGFNPEEMYPIDKKVARSYFGMNEKDFIILNLNRNQPRKRWDTCLKAFAEVVSRKLNSNIKLLIATNVKGAWNLLEIYERELNKRGITLDEGLKHIIVIDRPQQMSDFETNILYNVADIGINTCDGEGFGLCNFEQAALGIPQIVPNLGGFKDFFSDDSAELIETKMSFYVDSSRDSVAGEALLTDYVDYVVAIEKLYEDTELRESYSKKSRENILSKYKWPVLADRLHDTIYNVLGKEKPVTTTDTPIADAETTTPIADAETTTTPTPIADAETTTTPTPIADAETTTTPIAEAETTTTPTPIAEAETTTTPTPIAEAETTTTPIAEGETTTPISGKTKSKKKSKKTKKKSKEQIEIDLLKKQLEILMAERAASRN